MSTLTQISRILKGGRIRNSVGGGKILGRIGTGRGAVQELSIAAITQAIKVGNGGKLGGGSTSFADPTASVGLTAVNGSASTAMRSDAAPALDVTISPTWSGNHTFDNDMVVHGLAVGLGANAISSNVAFGASALAANTTGSENVAIGGSALQANTTGGSNFGLGYHTLFHNTTGSNNVGVGAGALSMCTTGGANVAIGSNTLQGITTTSANTAIGCDALNVSTGSNNTAIGYEALLKATTASYNIGIGRGSLSGITTGGVNLGIGDLAGNAFTTELYNTVVGAHTGTGFTGTNNNVVLADGQSNVAFWSRHGHGSYAPEPLTVGAAAAPTTSAVLDLNSTDGALLVPRMTTTQRNALTPSNGMIIYNTTIPEFEIYQNGSWSAMISVSMTSITFSGARVTPSSNLTGVNYTTKTAIPFNSENFDTNAYHDNVTNNTRLTVPASVNYVEVTGAVQTVNDTSSTWGLLQIWKNGVGTGTLVGTNQSQGVSGSKNMGVNSGPLAVVAGDYFELAFQEQSDTSVDIEATTTWFAIKALG